MECLPPIGNQGIEMSTPVQSGYQNLDCEWPLGYSTVMTSYEKL